jgi:large subunit ribosomal protein L15
VVKTVNVRELDEDAVVLVSQGLAEETDSGYRIDVRDVVEDGHEADAVKVLGAGRVHNELEIVADEFSETARELIEAAGGTATLTERGEERNAEADTTEETEEAE